MLPNCIEVVSKELFQGCQAQYLVVPSNVKEIEDHVFENCGTLKRVTF